MKHFKRKALFVLVAVLLVSANINFSFATTSNLDAKEINEAKHHAALNFDKETYARKLASLESGKTLRAATGNVAKFNGQGYKTLQEAVDAAKAGGTIEILADIDNQFAYVDMKPGTKLNINFNGHYLESYIDAAMYVMSGNVYISNAQVATTVDDAVVFIADGENSYIHAKNCQIILAGDGNIALGASDKAVIEAEYVDIQDASYISDEFDPKSATAAAAISGGQVKLYESNIEIKDGNGIVASEGKAYANGLYIACDNGTPLTALDAGTLEVRDGYYYGNKTVDIDKTSKATIYKGEFDNSIEGKSAIVAEDYSKVIISSNSVAYPKNWKTTLKEDKIDVINNAAAPTELTAKLSTYNSVKLNWKKSAKAKKYMVYYKKTSATAYTYAGTTKNSYYTIKNLGSGYGYTFRVYSCDVLDYTTKAKTYKTKYVTSGTIRTLKKLGTPSASKYATGKVKISWTNISGESGYQISKSTSKSGTNIVSTINTTTGKSKVLKVTKGKTYYYKVRAYKIVNGSKIYAPWSSVRTYKLR